MFARRKIVPAALASLLILLPLGAHLTTGVVRGIERLILSHYPNAVDDFRQFLLDLNQDVVGIGSTRNFPLIRLSLSRKDAVHFSELIRRYNGCNEYYKQNNKWRKAKLYFEGISYAVKIKSHGRCPHDHIKGKFISLTVKLLNGAQIRKTTRFNLIVRERLTFWGVVYKDFAELFGLLAQEIDLVRVQINNWDEKLFYFEKRLNDAYMESIGKSSLRRFVYDDGTNSTDKSMVYNPSELPVPFSEETFRRKFRQVLAETDYSEISRQGFFERYLNFNRAIGANKVDEIIEYVDFDYITDLLAAVTVGGLLHHGFTGFNLYVFLDSANGKFYPVMQRDILQRSLEPGPGETFEEKNNDNAVRSPLFHVLAQNDLIRQAKYRKIYDFIKTHGEETIRRQEDLWKEHESLHYLGMMKLLASKFAPEGWIGGYKNHTGNNISVLKNYIARSELAYRIHLSDGRIAVHIEPDSMSAIHFSEFKIKTSNRFAPKLLKLQIFSRFGGQPMVLAADREYVFQSNSGYVDLLPAFKKYGLSTALGPGSEAVNRSYVITLEFDGGLPAGFSREDIEFGFKNSITQEAVSAKEIPLHTSQSLIKNLPENDFPQSRHPLETWKKAHPFLKASVEKGNVIRLHPGDHELYEDLIFPETAKLVIGPGTTVRIAAGKAILVRNGAEIIGTASQPVIITSVDPDKPFGSVGILGNTKASTNISHLHLSNGSERWIEGIYLLGALSIHYNDKVSIADSIFTNNRADDGINIKNGFVTIKNSRFVDNAFDQIDLDYCQGTIENSDFINSRPGDNNNQDGLDISGSKILVSNSQFYGLRDKGVSIGEETSVILYANSIEHNNTGVAVKDLSRAYFVDNAFIENKADIHLFQKKSIFGGGHAYLINPDAAGTGIVSLMDKRSSLQRLQTEDAPLKSLIKSESDGIDDLFLRLEQILRSPQSAATSTQGKAL